VRFGNEHALLPSSPLCIDTLTELFQHCIAFNAIDSALPAVLGGSCFLFSGLGLIPHIAMS
jgi:hypothetical protein